METAAPSKNKRTYTRVSIHDQPSDFAYWQTQPYAVRLATLELIRREYHRWKYGAEPRLQRVCAIVRLQVARDSEPNTEP